MFGDVVGSVAPILLLIALGMVLRRTPVLDDPTVDGLKRLIVYVALPAVLFTTFAATSFRLEHLWVIAVVVAICFATLGLGYLFHRLTKGSAYQPFLFSGFELGMLGFALFAAAYGIDQLPAIGVLALGHETFIWFVYVTLMRRVGHQARSNLFLDLIKTPTIIAILAGVAFSLSGWTPALTETALGTAVHSTLRYLAAIIVPLVLLIVGYGARLTWDGIRQALPLVVTRLVLVVSAALLIGQVVFTGWLGLEPIYAKALFTLMVLPPPFIVPLFIPSQRRQDLTYTNNVLSLYSLASVAIFISYLIATG